ncbi:alpha/beta fold hydrolase [Novosphingobium piscinae]|uniref:Alpha/beta fold hydrolase n=1 Tax=Novosphingobium piscinae TaxID=1507448 RepID=A0A7X1KPP1_9SPHN|nr:alpha/beta fold hydrolase [Novosphingobium piscinae]MBC2668937.1 alpha/beta fold hydrolase [Novosphingobium piscinae]
MAVHRLGTGRPVLLLHGLFSSAEVNWIKYGTAEAIAAAGFEAIMPDLRAHGQSAHPHDPAAYPEDVLVRDLTGLVDQLGLADYDLCGFSLGARTALKGVAEAGLTPRRLILSGMGLAGIQRWSGRIGFFLDAIARFGTIPRGDPAYFAQAFMKSTGTDLVASRLLLESFQAGQVSDFAAVTMPTLLLCGSEDDDNGSAEELAAVLPNATHAAMPGTHMTSVTKREFGAGIVAFLTG